VPTHRKADLIGEIADLFAKSEVAILSDYRGISVAQVGQLRATLRPTGARFRVVKNTLTRIAAARAGLSGVDEILAGPTAVTFTGEDVGASARALRDALRTMPMLELKGAIVSGRLVPAEAARQLADLPGKSTLQAELAGAIQGPLTKFVGVLNDAISNLVYVLEARAEKVESAA